MNHNHFSKYIQEKEDSLIINDDLFEQKDLISDNDQIIVNEQDDDECSFLSNESDNKEKIIPENNIISNNINCNTNTVNELYDIVDKNHSNIENILKREIDHERNQLNNKLINNEIINGLSEINNKEVHKSDKENEKLSSKSPKGNNKYFTKKILNPKDKKPIITSENKKKENQQNNDNNILNNNKKESKLNQNISKNNQDVKKQKSKKSYINKIKEKKNIKINYSNHSKLVKKNSRNYEEHHSYLNNPIKGEVNNYDKYGNKTVIKKKEEKIRLYRDDKNKKNNTSQQKMIKLDKKLNKSYDNLNKHNNKINSPKNRNGNSTSTKVSIKKNNITNNTTPRYKSRNESKSSFDAKKSNENNHIDHTEKLKKILINKINNQINEIIKGREKMFFNENNKLFFLGFCDLLFEIGFLHIKETEINDISNIKNHITDLYTQPFTNRALLSENFLFHEQHLLICAWKTILTNFSLIIEFHTLPEENEEITLDDCKLFIFIVTGLFIGFNTKSIDINSEKINSKKKNYGIFNKNNSDKNLINKIKMNSDEKSKNKNKKDNKYHFRKKSEKNAINDSNSEDNKNMNENILMNILKKRQKTEYNYKNILKIKNFFTYFAELRKLYNLYQKELKNIKQKLSFDKELTFQPKTNKSDNKILLSKFSDKMDFFQRNDVIKKRNEKKIVILQRERSNKLLKECTFEPCQEKNKSNKKTSHKNVKEISNRLYNNKYSSKNKSEKNSQNLNNTELSQSSSRKIYLKTHSDLNPHHMCNRVEKIFNEKKTEEEIYQFKPNINKKLNRVMFSKSPLNNDELVNKRVKDLRDANLYRFIQNYEKNNREFISNDIKNDKNLVKEIIFAEKKNMKLDMEKKTNKDTFDNFINEYDLPSFENGLYDNYNQMQISEPLFTVEIKIKENIKIIEVYKDDIPEKLAYDFCIENSLGKGSYEKILNIIQNKLDEINNNNYNQNEEIPKENEVVDNDNKILNEKKEENNNDNINMNIEFNDENNKNDFKENISINFNDNIEKEPDISNECNDDMIPDMENYENNIDDINKMEKEENKFDSINNEEKKPDINNIDIEEDNNNIYEENDFKEE